MNTGAKTFAAIAAVAAMTVGFRGTAQALPTSYFDPQLRLRDVRHLQPRIDSAGPTTWGRPNESRQQLSVDYYVALDRLLHLLACPRLESRLGRFSVGGGQWRPARNRRRKPVFRQHGAAGV